MTWHIIVFLFGTPFQLEQIACFWPKTQGCWVLAVFDLYVPDFRIYCICSGVPMTTYIYKGVIQLVWSHFPVCGHASVTLGKEDKDKHVPFSLHNLSESFFSCLGARTGVPVYPEREGERERGLAIGLPRQQGTVQAWWWKKRGSELIGITGVARGHLCALRYSTLLSKGGKEIFFHQTKLNYK